MTTGVRYALVALWLSSIAVGLCLLTNHQFAAGSSGQVGTDMPPVLAQIAGRRDSADTAPTCFLVAHPQCPCTTVALEQIRPLMQRYPNGMIVRVLLVKPSHAEPDFDLGRVRDAAAAMPGVRVTVLEEPEARTLGVRTSGHILCYTADGTLLLSGGITQGRGHAGPNAGLDDFERIWGGQAARLLRHPVFGCPLFDDDSCGNRPTEPPMAPKSTPPAFAVPIASGRPR